MSFGTVSPQLIDPTDEFNQDLKRGILQPGSTNILKNRSNNNTPRRHNESNLESFKKNSPGRLRRGLVLHTRFPTKADVIVKEVMENKMDHVKKEITKLKEKEHKQSALSLGQMLEARRKSVLSSNIDKEKEN